MSNPYAPSHFETLSSSPPNILRGTLAGLGLGLLSCDILDLFSGDGYALRGWLAGIAMLTSLGTLVGWLNRGRTKLWGGSLKSSSAHLAWQGLGGGIFLEGALPLFVHVEKPDLILPWSVTMVAAGCAYMVLPLFFTWNEAAEADFGS